MAKINTFGRLAMLAGFGNLPGRTRVVWILLFFFSFVAMTIMMMMCACAHGKRKETKSQDSAFQLHFCLSIYVF